MNVIILLKNFSLRLSKPLYVCNGYSDKNRCILSKKLYSAFDANKSYQIRLADPRKGIILNDADIERLKNIVGCDITPFF